MDIQKIRKLQNPKVLVFGEHPGTLQSILDFDFLAGKEQPSIIGVVGVRQRYLRYFWGRQETLLPGFISFDELENETRDEVDLFVVAESGRRASATARLALKEMKNVQGGIIFAEGVPEQHALALRRTAQSLDKFVLGPASVGLAVGGVCKLGAIGGTLPEQIVQARITKPGSVAVISTSGGMINELINAVASNGGGISFAAAVGGERYPVTKPVQLVEQAIKDPKTKSIVFFGELGGRDEYEVAKLLKKSKTKKPLVAYIAGSIAEKFEAAPQFGHAKSMAQNASESASAKKQALRDAGASVADTFAGFEDLLETIIDKTPAAEEAEEAGINLQNRRPALFFNRISSDNGGEVKILGSPLLDFVGNRTLSEIALSMFLGEQVKSKKLISFFDLCVRLLVDHGPQVSGAVNTMITARAGKDIASSLASGILTIGPRFGGAINDAAMGWFEGVGSQTSPDAFVEKYARNKQLIAGIGHKKYRSDQPDPRVMLLMSKFDRGGKYTTFAKKVEKITTGKKAQLILNVDGAIAALLLDILADSEKYSQKDIELVLKSDFCNAIFVFARSVGFIAHYLEQRRLDENLFRLPDNQIGSF